MINNPIGRLFDNLFGTGKSWWIEIKTESPSCTYYFGPFNDANEAETYKAGYIEDLEQEGAQRIQAQVMRCSDPEKLTIFDESEEYRGVPSPIFSGQA